MGSVLFLTSMVFASVYFWVDDQGVKHFTNTNPPSDQIIEELKEIKGEYFRHPFTVVTVFDGDTIKVRGMDLTFTVRLVGIDCPEMGFRGKKSQPFGHEAREYLISLLGRQKIALKSYGTGGYNRQLAEIFVDAKNINIEMIRAGLAEVYKGKTPENFDSRMYINAELTAKRKKKGMWRQGDSYMSPRQWRKENPRK